MQNYFKRVRKWVTLPNFEILGPLHISETVGARNVKLGMQIQANDKSCKKTANIIVKNLAVYNAF